MNIAQKQPLRCFTHNKEIMGKKLKQLYNHLRYSNICRAMDAKKGKAGSREVILRCPNCGKSYKRQSVFDKHVGKCILIPKKSIFPNFKSRPGSNALIKGSSIVSKHKKVTKLKAKRPCEGTTSKSVEAETQVSTTLLRQVSV